MKKLIILLLFIAFNYSHAQWTEVNNGLYGADVVSMAVQGDNFIICTKNPGGVYLSSNKGESWQKANNGLNNNIVNCLAINGNTIIAGTKADGVYISNDIGKNWIKKSTGLTNLFIWCITVNGDDIYIGTQGAGLFVSKDDCENWTSINGNLNKPYIYSIVADKGKLFVGTICNYNKESGFFVSTDNGNTWISNNNGLTLTEPITKIVYNDSYIYVISILNKVYVSSDNGESWYSANNFPYGSGGVIDLIVKDGSVIACSYFRGIFVSVNNGITWVEAKKGLTDEYMNFIVSYGDTIYSGTQGSGIFQSTDYGNNWSKLGMTGLKESIANCIIANDNILYAGTKDAVFISTDYGDSWVRSSDSLKNTNVRGLAFNDGILFAVTELGLFQSDDKGMTWVENLKYYSYPYNFRCLATMNSIIYIGSSGGNSFLKSFDNGETWKQIDNSSPLFNKAVMSIGLVGDKIYAGTWYEGVFYSSDNGVTWTFLETLPMNNVKSFLEYGHNIFAGGAGYGLFKSTNDGLEWQKYITDTQFDSAKFYSLAAFENNIFAGTENKGIYLSKDSGATWEQINTGLETTSISEMLVAFPFVYAATNNMGIFRARLADFGLTEVEESHIPNNSELTIYPNPAGDYIEIDVRANGGSPLPQDNIHIYNTLGQCVMNVGIQNFESLRIDISSLPTGVYSLNCGGMAQMFVKGK
jgi:photosystem II stability/assembly factor-like uncharacterized protein